MDRGRVTVRVEGLASTGFVDVGDPLISSERGHNVRGGEQQPGQRRPWDGGLKVRGVVPDDEQCAARRHRLREPAVEHLARFLGQVQELRRHQVVGRRDGNPIGEVRAR